MSSIQFSGLSEFVRVVELRSFKLAAESLGVSKPAISKSISRLESRLGVILLNRTTRSVSPTYEGELFYLRCRKIIDDMHDSIDEVMSFRQNPKGVLRIDCVVAVGQLLLVPALPKFLKKHPDILIDLRLNDHVVDMVEENVDVVIRIGIPKQSELIARRVLQSRMIVAGAPEYLTRHGIPTDPKDLANFDCLKFIKPDGRIDDWLFLQEDAQNVQLQESKKVLLNSAISLVDLAVSGVGLVQLMDFIISKELQAGSLQEVLSDYSAPSLPIYIGYHRNRYLSTKVRFFIDFLNEHVFKV